MVRVQIQLPDDVFAKATKLCETREISLNELACCGIERMPSVFTIGERLLFGKVVVLILGDSVEVREMKP